MNTNKNLKEILNINDAYKIRVQEKSEGKTIKERKVTYYDEHDHIIYETINSTYKSSTIVNSYDEHNNLVSSISADDERRHEYIYNDKGQITLRRDIINQQEDTGSYHYIYDALGRLSDVFYEMMEPPHLSTRIFRISYYNTKTLALVETSPDALDNSGAMVFYNYDKKGRLSKIHTDGGALTVCDDEIEFNWPEYLDNSILFKSMRFIAGDIKFEYDDNDRLSTIATQNNLIKLTYDSDGNIIMQRAGESVIESQYIYPHKETGTADITKNQKYEMLTDETIDYDGHKLYRIRALKDLTVGVQKGDLGGFIESPSNLSDENNCWVAGNAKIFDNAVVENNAHVSGNAVISENSLISDHAEVSGSAIINGNTKVYSNAKVKDFAIISDKAVITGNAIISGRAEISENARISSYVEISENAEIAGNSKILGHVKVYGDAVVTGKSRLGGDVKVYGNVVLVDANDFGSTNYYGDICDQ